MSEEPHDYLFSQPIRKDFTERLVELIKDDKELHDAAVRMINALAEQTEISNQRRREKYNKKEGL